MDIDLIICDVEMPLMNGFEFLGMRRRDSALAKVPTFMLTSRSGDKHRNLAKQLGSDGYFNKPYVEQDFIQEIKKILDSQNPSEPETQTAIAIQTKTILIIDDSSALRRTLALSLEQKGYRVLQGRDGIEGLEQLRILRSILSLKSNNIFVHSYTTKLRNPVSNSTENYRG